MFGAGGECAEVVLVDGADDDHVYDAGVAAAGVVAGDQGAVYIAEAPDHGFDLVDSQRFVGESVKLGVQGVVAVGPVVALVAIVLGCDQSGILEPLEFGSYRVGGFAEFFGQGAQVPGCAAVGEELEQQPNAGAGCDQGFKQGCGGFSFPCAGRHEMGVRCGRRRGNGVV